MDKKRIIYILIAVMLIVPLLSGTSGTLDEAKAASKEESLLQVDEDTVYYDRFMELFEDIQTKGYLSPEGVPYHSVETLMVEAPDYGHLTTSEAFSFLTWLYATYGKLTGDWSYYKEAWDVTERYIIPDASRDQPGINTYPPDDPAQYAPEADLPQDYPVAGDESFSTGVDPICDELSRAYGSKAYYQMHWLLDVDNWYGYGNHGDGTSRCSYINTYQRGPEESVWETVPHPSWEDFTWGAGNDGGFLPLFGKFGTPSKQWRYTSASDADARQVQASYWALQWAKEQGRENEIGSYTSKAVKMGDWLRYTMFDKYFRPIGVQNNNTKGTGYDSCHYLLSWYTSWGGDTGGSWSWRIGCSHVHQGYQNIMAAYAMSEEPDMEPLSQNGKRDWATSLQRQIELYHYLQSAEGAIAGGVTNSMKGRYESYPAGTSTFYDMAYDWQPVYHDPPSNNWFGFQAWSMERVMEYYYITGDTDVKSLVDKWSNWIVGETRLNSDGTFEIPSTLKWTGQPDTWTGTPTGNPNLHVTVEDWCVDLGVTACLAKALTYYAAGCEKWDGAVAEDAQYVAKELLDRMWTLYRDDIGLAAPEEREDYSRFFDEVYIPTDYSGVNAQGATLKNGMTFIDLRPAYRDDPDFQKVEDAYRQGKAPVMTYHRFWAQADIAMANAMYHILFGSGEPSDPGHGDDPALPKAPKGIKATALSTSSIKIEWDKNTESDLAGYKVYGSTLSNFIPSSSNLIGQVTTNSYTDTGLNADTTYYYKVTAVNTNGDESQPSAQASAKTESNGGTEPSPEYTEISVPFTSDGEGEFYWKTNKFSTNPGDWGRYINSWNLDVLEINGVDYTNTWVAQHQIPASSDGYWYIHCKSSVPWAHVEIN